MPCLELAPPLTTPKHFMTQRRICQPLKRSFRLAFPNVHWLTTSLASTAALSLVMLWSGFRVVPDMKEPLYYLLSAQAETLGSLFVLAFTFTLVAAQITSRYSHIMLNRVIGTWALWYAIPFGLSILLPLYLLRGELYLWSAQGSLLLASYCVFSLLPFVVAVRRLLSISEALSDLKEELSTADGRTAADLVGRLGNISLGALNLGDYETFELGVAELLEGASPDVASGTFRLAIVKEMRRLIIRTLHEQFASETLSDAIFRLGVIEPIEASLDTDDEVLNEVVEAYRAINVSALRNVEPKLRVISRHAEVAIGRGDRLVVSRLQSLAHVIGNQVIVGASSTDELPQQTIATLGNIVQRVMNEGGLLTNQASVVRSGILAIEYLGTKGLGLGRYDVRDSAIQQLQRVTQNSSDIGRQVEGNARASISVLRG